MSTSKLDLSKVSVSDIFNGSDSFATEPATEVDETVDSSVETDNEESVDSETEEVETSTAETSAEDSEEEDTESETPTAAAEEDSLIAELQTKLGYATDEEFEDSIDGLLEFTKTTAQKMAAEQMQNLFNAYPDVQEYLNFRAQGGDPKKYFQTAAPSVDYSDMEISEGDVMTQKKVVGAYLASQGFEAEEIQETLNDYEDAGILQRHATKALSRMQDMQKKEKNALIEQQRIEAERRQQENDQMWNEIGSIIGQGSLKGITVPERDKKRFFDWMAIPVDREGNSQRSLDRANLDQETLLALEYIVYRGFDLSKLIANQQKTQQAQTLRSKLSKGVSTTSRMKSSKPGYTKATKLPGLNELL